LSGRKVITEVFLLVRGANLVGTDASRSLAANASPESSVRGEPVIQAEPEGSEEMADIKAIIEQA
jgi:hypothetical protein